MSNRNPRPGAFEPHIAPELARQLCASSGHRHDGKTHQPVHETAEYTEHGYTYRGTWCNRCGSQLARIVIASPADAVTGS